VKSISPEIQTKIKFLLNREYLNIRIRTESIIELIISSADVFQKEDLDFLFWGERSITAILDLLKITQPEKKLLYSNDELGKRISSDIILSWARKNKSAREKRDESIKATELVLSQLHKQFLREDRQIKNAAKVQTSDIITKMDGSALLWLCVILSAKKDFLIGHSDQRRLTKWERLKPIDLLDENGVLKREFNDAWDYLTAREFLFNDEYTIDIGDRTDNEDGFKQINCRDLLENIIDVCSGKEVDSSFVNPSIEHLRSTLAEKSGDPKLISLYTHK